ncbi:unnamed protein product [Ambrosiozyma monospora]|uniref:Unnamed protein product n=1 Tax=Ambrosiozyma monospora TaxID=43982 RepID=A0ACB5UDI5_AMBMO|nr:unnamed protein product [Ambrosiozyma monospora]
MQTLKKTQKERALVRNIWRQSDPVPIEKIGPSPEQPNIEYERFETLPRGRFNVPSSPLSSQEVSTADETSSIESRSESFTLPSQRHRFSQQSQQKYQDFQPLQREQTQRQPNVNIKHIDNVSDGNSSNTKNNSNVMVSLLEDGCP